MLVTDGDNDYETPAEHRLVVKYEDSNKYEIPSELEGLFDSMVKAINQEYKFTDEWGIACDAFDEQFNKYGVHD